MTGIDISHFMPQAEIAGDDAEDTLLLQSMAAEAREYIESFPWCPGLREIYFAAGIGGVVGLFVAEFPDPLPTGDSMVWVVTGDLPSAYFVADEAPTAREAFHVYKDLMEQWISSTEKERESMSVFPVAAQPTPENFSALRERLEFLERESRNWLQGY